MKAAKWWWYVKRCGVIRGPPFRIFSPLLYQLSYPANAPTPYYARCKVNGKPVRASLDTDDTDVFPVAKQRLPDKIKELRKPKVEVGTFADGRLPFEQQTRGDGTLPIPETNN